MIAHKYLVNKILHECMLPAVNDRVGALVNQWASERPDLDLASMATIARALTLGRMIEARLDALADSYGMTLAEGDLLFTLRRAPAPHRMLPSQLSASLLVSSGTMTSRLDRLEGRGLIRRVPNPDDRRSVLVELTTPGRDLADQAVTQHVKAEQAMLETLGERDRSKLDRLLSALIQHLTADV
jgi:DNA-binding MarR family transcriptional regulator